MRSVLSVTALAVVLVVAPQHAFARRCAGVSMRGTVEVDGQTLVLNGMGIREATVFNLDVFVAGLYLPEASTDGAAIIRARGLKRLVLHFVRDVPRDGLASGLTDSFGAGLANQVRRFTGMLPAEITEGTIITLTYRPGGGLEVTVNGRRRGAISGDAFAGAFFRFLIGPNPPNSGLKRGLLGGHCD
jgi:hypothetical protein